MVHQPPLHFVAVLAYGTLSLVALGGFVMRVRQHTLNVQQRASRWLLLFMGIGFGCYTADAWYNIMLWRPPQRLVSYTVFFFVGSAFIAAAALGLAWVSLRFGDESESEKPLGPRQN